MWNKKPDQTVVHYRSDHSRSSSISSKESKDGNSGKPGRAVKEDSDEKVIDFEIQIELEELLGKRVFSMCYNIDVLAATLPEYTDLFIQIDILEYWVRNLSSFSGFRGCL
jgi:hypothetical protein